MKIILLAFLFLIISCSDGNHFNGNLSKPIIITPPTPNPPVVNLNPTPVSVLSSIAANGQAFLLAANHTYNDNNSGTANRSTEWKIYIGATEIATIPMALNSHTLSYAGLDSASTQGNLIIKNLSSFLSALGYTSGLSAGSQICFKSLAKNGLGNTSTTQSSQVCTTIASIIGCSSKPTPATNYNEVGDGSPATPFELWTPEQFYSFAQSGDMSASYIQCSDIDFTPFYLSNPEFKVTSIFSGIYDGNNFLLNHFKITDSLTVADPGLFDTMMNATLKNTHLINAVFNDPSNLYLGVVAKYAENTNTENVTIDFTSSSNILQESSGGFRDCVNCTIQNSSLKATITSGQINQFGGWILKSSNSTLTQAHVELTLTAELFQGVGALAQALVNSNVTQSSSRFHVTQKDLGLGYVTGTKAYVCGIVLNANASHFNETFALYDFTQEVNVYTHGIDGFVGETSGGSTYTNSYAKITTNIAADEFDEMSGFSGHTTDSTFTNIYSDITVNSSSTSFPTGASEYHGGITATDDGIITMKDVFTVSHVNAADPDYFTVFNRTIANSNSGTDMSSVYYADDTSCIGCGASGNPVPVATFYSISNAPLNAWDFTTIWKENTGAYPTLINNPE